MNKYELILLICYLLVEGIEYRLKFLNLRHMKRYGMNVPPGFEGYIDEPTLKKTIAYTIESSTLSFLESLFGVAVLLVFLFGGLLNIYNSWIVSLGLPFVLEGVLFFLLLGYASSILSIPFSLYDTFRIENKYGFNTMTLKLWIADLLKSLVLSTLLMGALLAGGLWIVQKSPEYWWLFAWGFILVVSLFMMYLSPYVIEPLFNKFTPLKVEGLEEKIRELMKKAGIRVSRVFAMDASKRSRHSNAYFSGIGKVKRIVLFDTLLQMATQEEVLGVLAHEAGHWKKKHILKMITAVEILSLAGMYLSFRLLKTGVIGPLFDIRDATFFAALVVLGVLFRIVSFPFTPLFSYLSRRHEDEADRFAVGLTSDPEGLATALIKLSRENLSNLHPHPLYAKIYYSHPPVVERIRKIRGAHMPNPQSTATSN
jgi:STE24 endopeptidase